MKISKELAKGSTGLLVLSVISKTDMYGYQIIKTLEVMSENVFSLNEGTLYPILHSLEKEGSLKSYWCEAEGRKRKTGICFAFGRHFYNYCFSDSIQILLSKLCFKRSGV